jgi:hypothetical protein
MLQQGNQRGHLGREPRQVRQTSSRGQSGGSHVRGYRDDLPHQRIPVGWVIDITRKRQPHDTGAVFSGLHGGQQCWKLTGILHANRHPSGRLLHGNPRDAWDLAQVGFNLGTDRDRSAEQAADL